mmetsp:Transcript_67123/g.101194  ORF Transcript_67123/g.101194 Transcript_67123/m.101194 type:complete len:394 (+) Transcript_67123:16-1197(+)
MQRLLSSVIVFCFILTVSAAGLYSPSSNVIQLSKQNFVEEVFDSPHIWMVEFYAPWCGHCKQLTPAWEAAASNLKGIVKIAAVNCDEDRELAGMFDVKGFPTIIFFGSEQVPNPHQKGMPWKNPEPYQGQRTASAIANYATSRLPNFVQTKNLDSFFDDSSLARVALFTDKAKTSNIYKALAIEFKDRLAFAQVSSKNKDLASKYNIENFPTFIVVDKDGATHQFEGKPSLESLAEFFEPFAKKVEKKQKQNRQNQQTKQEVEVDRPAELIEISDADLFAKNCLDKSGPSVIALFDLSSDEVEAQKATLLQVAEKYKKQFRFLWMDGPSHPSFAQQLFIDSGYPQVLVLNPSKMAMASLIGSYDENGISHFLDRVLLGSRRLIQKLDKLPTFE